MKKLFTSMLLVLALLGCKKNDTATPSTTAAVNVNVPAPFVIKEDFEMGTKAAYAIGPVSKHVVFCTGTYLVLLDTLFKCNKL
jgi:hypothetical protein